MVTGWHAASGSVGRATHIIIDSPGISRVDFTGSRNEAEYFLG